MNILILCTGNSCRSQMAEGWMRHYAPEGVKVFSAGVERHGLNPNAVAAMKRRDIDISTHKSNLVDDFEGTEWHKVITVCDHAHENCPYLPGTFERFHQNFEDPSKFEGGEEEKITRFDDACEKIRVFCEDFSSKIN